MIFDDSNAFKLRAQFDLMIIETQILLIYDTLPKNLFMKEDYAEKLSKIIIDEFMGNVLMKNIDGAV